MRKNKKKFLNDRWGKVFYTAKLLLFGLFYLFLAAVFGYLVFRFVPVFSYQIISAFLIAIFLSNVLAKLFIDYFSR